MIKKKLCLFSLVSLNFITVSTQMQMDPLQEKYESHEFGDIFDVEDDEQILVHAHDSEETEIEGLEEFAVKPTPPSQATILMRQLGIKILIGYIAMQTYFETLWLKVKEKAVQLRSWIVHEQIS